MIGFGFGSLAMLGWLAAAGVPLVIHLWSRRRHREVPWAAVEFLLAAAKKNARRIRLEQWCLLAVRTLLVALVVLAAAEPYMATLGARPAASQPTHRVLVVDGSFSMAYKPNERSRFDRAKELAAQIVEESPQGDGFTLVLLGEPPRVIVGRPAFDHGVFLQEIENLRLPHGGGDLVATLEKVEEILVAARRENPRLTQEEVYFLTDLHRATWVPDLGGGLAAEFRRRSKRLGEAASLVLLDVGQPGAENLAITGLSLADPVATVARPVALRADVRNFSGTARPRQRVELLVDGRRAGEEWIDVPGGGQASAAFSYRFESPGDHAVEARLAADRLELDNHRWLSVTVKPFVRVLCVNGKPSGEPFRGATDYLTVALAPGGGQPDRDVVRTEVATESSLVERELGDYDAVFLANVPQFTAREARILETYVAGGGGLVFFLGDQVLADRYNRELAGQGKGSVRILPDRLDQPVAEGKYSFDPLEYRHPIVRPFLGREEAGLVTTPVSRYFRLAPAGDAKARVALAFRGGDPAIVEATFGRGRTIVVATSADTSWTAMPVWPSYVPVVQELLNFALGGQSAARNLRVGQSLGGALRGAENGRSPAIRLPDGRAEPVQLHSDGAETEWSYADTAQSGIYAIRLGGPGSRPDLFAVNVNTAESDLARVEPDQLRAGIWSGVPFVHRTTWQNEERKPAAGIADRGGQLARSLLFGVLGLVLLETFLAWRFGHHEP